MKFQAINLNGQKTDNVELSDNEVNADNCNGTTVAITGGGAIEIFIDASAIMYILGSKIDYIDNGMESGFVFSNPNEKGRCGCGESFSV